MSWTEATFKNRSGKSQQVWVHTDDDGAPIVDEGRVAMRYNEAADAKVYSAHPGNISLGGTSKPAPAPKANGASVVVDDSVWKSPAGDQMISRAVPLGLEEEGLPPAGTIDAWTDGACTGNPGPSGYGVVLRFGENYLEIGQYIGTGTNNIAELLAIGVALDEIRDIEGRVRIHTDSTYSIGVLSKGWKAKANIELIGWIKELVAERDIEFVKVKGHAGIPLNERADRLAVAAVERRS